MQKVNINVLTTFWIWLPPLKTEHKRFVRFFFQYYPWFGIHNIPYELLVIIIFVEVPYPEIEQDILNHTFALNAPLLKD